MSSAVPVEAVEAAAKRRRDAKAAGRSYEDQLAFEQATGVTPDDLVSQALAFLDQGAEAAAVTNGTLELVLPDWQWRRRTWQPHPQCGCHRPD